MALPPKPSTATIASASTSAAPSTASTPAVSLPPARSSPVLPSKPLGLPQRPTAPLGNRTGPKSDTDREEGEEEEPVAPPKRNPIRVVPSNPLPPPGRRGRSPSFDRDDRSFSRGGAGGGGGGGRFDYDDRRGGQTRGRMVSRSPLSPARSYRSGRSWSRSRSRSPGPPRRGGPNSFKGYGGRRPISRSPPPFGRRPISRSRSPPPRRRYDSRPPLSPEFRRRSRSPPPRGYGRPRPRSFSRSPPPRRYSSISPPPSNRGGRRGRSRTRSPPPPPPSHAPFTARAKRNLPPPQPEEEDDMIFRKSRRYSRSNSIVSSGSHRPPARRRSPSPAGRRRSPSLSPRSRRGSYSPPPRSYRRRSSTPPFRRSISPRQRSWSRSPPPSVRHSRGHSPGFSPYIPDGPAASRIPPATLDPSIPTGPRNRFGPPSALPTRPAASRGIVSARGGFQKVGPVSTSSSSALPIRPLPTGPAAASVPTGPKAWRSIQTPSAFVPPAISTSASPAPPSQSETPILVKSESPRPPSPAPPPLPATLPPPPPSTSIPATIPTAPSVLPAHLIKERELRQAQLELKRRTAVLARFLPRSVGGLLVNVQGITQAMMQSPGVEIESEIARYRTARLNSLEDHASKLLMMRKADYNLQSARAEAEVARERTRLAGGERGDLQAGTGMVSAGGGGGGGGGSGY